MTDQPQPTPPRVDPPGICSHCLEHQIHHPRDTSKVSWYCAHRSTWTIWNETARQWIVREGVTPDVHRLALELTTQLAVQADAFLRKFLDGLSAP